MLFIAALNIKNYEGLGIFFCFASYCWKRAWSTETRYLTPIPRRTHWRCHPRRNFPPKFSRTAISRLRVASFSDLFAVLHTFKLKLVYYRKKSLYQFMNSRLIDILLKLLSWLFSSPFSLTLLGKNPNFGCRKPYVKSFRFFHTLCERACLLRCSKLCKYILHCLRSLAILLLFPFIFQPKISSMV